MSGAPNPLTPPTDPLAPQPESFDALLQSLPPPKAEPTPQYQAERGYIATDQGTILDYRTDLGDLFTTGFTERWEENLLAAGGRSARRLTDEWTHGFRQMAGVPDNDWVLPDAARAEVKQRGLDLEIPEAGLSRWTLDMLQWLKQRENDRKVFYARPRPTGGTAAAFAGGLAGEAVNPLNVATAFIPFVPAARYTSALAWAGESALARAGVRAAVGAGENAAAVALLEPLQLGASYLEQRDYTLTDSFLNVVFGGLVGGGLHAIGGGAFDYVTGSNVGRALAGAASDGAHLNALQRAVHALEEGRPVDADRAFAEHYNLPDDTFTRSAGAFDRARLAEAADIVALARDAGAPIEAAGGTATVDDAIRAMGGLKLRDETGALTPTGEQLVDQLKARDPALINNVSGLPPEQMAQALARDGWFARPLKLEDALAAIRQGGGVRVTPSTGMLSTEAKALLVRAGVTAGDKDLTAAQKVVAFRGADLRSRIARDPDFDPRTLFPSTEGAETRAASQAASDFRVAPDDERTIKAAEIASRQAARGPSAMGDAVDKSSRMLGEQIDHLTAGNQWTEADLKALPAIVEPSLQAAAAYERAAKVFRAAATCMITE